MESKIDFLLAKKFSEIDKMAKDLVSIKTEIQTIKSNRPPIKSITKIQKHILIDSQAQFELTKEIITKKPLTSSRKLDLNQNQDKKTIDQKTFDQKTNINSKKVIPIPKEKSKMNKNGKIIINSVKKEELSKTQTDFKPDTKTQTKDDLNSKQNTFENINQPEIQEELSILIFPSVEQSKKENNKMSLEVPDIIDAENMEAVIKQGPADLRDRAKSQQPIGIETNEIEKNIIIKKNSTRRMSKSHSQKYIVQSEDNENNDPTNNKLNEHLSKISENDEHESEEDKDSRFLTEQQMCLKLNKNASNSETLKQDSIIPELLTQMSQYSPECDPNEFFYCEVEAINNQQVQDKEITSESSLQLDQSEIMNASDKMQLLEEFEILLDQSIDDYTVINPNRISPNLLVLSNTLSFLANSEQFLSSREFLQVQALSKIEELNRKITWIDNFKNSIAKVNL